MRPYSLMSIRWFLGAFVALAMLFAPTMAAAADHGTAMPNHNMQMTATGHCKAPPSKVGDEGKAAGMNCCMSMCMAVAVTPNAPIEVQAALPQPPAVSVVAAFHLGEPAEIATPPPRLA